ncbi:uncharacterized protein PHACADRAFT_214668 [Phanerochaete carnosa HHB-10118-sp]|uniref:Uncharacterized protein n=1 Tax=Phanerochaete carnosa (strain HHB-10118-sp) TaxID=650164 RepID=K5VCG0_PHACS|nr:uncharacterized protein PHACADRAFT_214668 [Phanerochaete carnosa HHB-10118-sp]EKM48773.1 hypothetical protein PHACADRAFT_214668 [Phanerochaete carnosa HHB-10118-sp]
MLLLPLCPTVPVRVTPTVQARAADAGGNLFVCADANWQGSCTNIGFGASQCVVFPSGFQNDVSAIGPPSGWVCDAYVNFSCTGDGLGDITNPGIADLGDGNTNYNDRLNSFVCLLL